MIFVLGVTAASEPPLHFTLSHRSAETLTLLTPFLVLRYISRHFILNHTYNFLAKLAVIFSCLKSIILFPHALHLIDSPINFYKIFKYVEFLVLLLKQVVIIFNLKQIAIIREFQALCKTLTFVNNKN